MHQQPAPGRRALKKSASTAGLTTGAAHKAKIIAVMGASGSGKSLYVKQGLKTQRPRRLLVWDPLHEYGEFGHVVTSLADLAERCKAQTFALCFHPSADPAKAKKQFDVFCQIAYAAGSLTLVAEELAFVTSPSWAPAGWSMVTLKGRHKGLTVYGNSQRPASIDKNFFGNATIIRTGRLNFAADVKVLANVLQVQALEVQSLQPLEYIERDMGTGAISRGKATF